MRTFLRHWRFYRVYRVVLAAIEWVQEGSRVLSRLETGFWAYLPRKWSEYSHKLPATQAARTYQTIIAWVVVSGFLFTQPQQPCLSFKDSFRSIEPSWWPFNFVRTRDFRINFTPFSHPFTCYMSFFMASDSIDLGAILVQLKRNRK